MKHLPPSPSTPPTTVAGPLRALTALLGALELGAGAYGLHATLAHRAAYPAGWQYATDVALFSLLALSGLGLLRRRRWAARITTALLYVAFFGVLVALSLLYTPGRWWYWLLPLLLPALGYAVYALRRQRAAFVARW
ncbi:MAG: hypothetical protein RLW62_18445 [Gammaproteobacteria bacterium]